MKDLYLDQFTAPSDKGMVDPRVELGADDLLPYRLIVTWELEAR